MNVLGWSRAGVGSGIHPRPGRRAHIARSTVAVLLGGSLALGCEQGAQTFLVGHAVAEEDVAKLKFGKSTPDDVERTFGQPDEREPDGSLVYRATAVRRIARGVGGLSWQSEEEVGTRVAKFRFAGGVLSQLCRERS